MFRAVTVHMVKNYSFISHNKIREQYPFLKLNRKNDIEPEPLIPVILIIQLKARRFLKDLT